MKDFESFYDELKSDELWFCQASMHHKTETFTQVANKVYMEYVGRGSFPPIGESRVYVYNKVCKILPDKVKLKWYDVAPKDEPKKDEAPPLKRGSPEYIQRLNEWQEQINKAPMMQPVPKPSSREIIENGQWRVKAPTIHEPTELEKRTAYFEHIEMMRRCRSKVYTDAFPEATADEIEAYIQKYAHLDNPLNL